MAKHDEIDRCCSGVNDFLCQLTDGPWDFHRS